MPSPTEHDRDGYEASELARGLPEARAEETAARTVREHRRLEGRTPNRTTQGTGNPNVPLAGRAKAGLDNLARERDTPGRSKLSQSEFARQTRGVVAEFQKPRWRNFKTWQGVRLPHWRADDVTYFVTFRSRRPLDEGERLILYRCLLRLDGRRLDMLALTVLPERTELLTSVRQGTGGEPYELSDLIEKAKDKAGRAIIKATGERFPPFYNESYDHILRDEDERAQFLDALIDGALEGEAVETPEDWPTLYVSDAGGHEPEV